MIVIVMIVLVIVITLKLLYDSNEVLSTGEHRYMVDFPEFPQFANTKACDKNTQHTCVCVYIYIYI